MCSHLRGVLPGLAPGTWGARWGAAIEKQDFSGEAPLSAELRGSMAWSASLCPRASQLLMRLLPPWIASCISVLLAQACWARRPQLAVCWPRKASRGGSSADGTQWRVRKRALVRMQAANGQANASQLS